MAKKKKRTDSKKVVRHDFMSGHGKANGRDKLTRQVAGSRRKISYQEVNDLYADSSIVQNIVNIPAEDMTRNWFSLRMKDNKLAANIMSKLADLKAKQAFKDMRKFERLQGDGFISIGVTQNEQFTLADELPDRVKSVDYLHAFSSLKVAEFIINEDMFSENYGQLDLLNIDRNSRTGNIMTEQDAKVHVSRLIHDQTRRIESEYQGQSLLEPMYDILTVLDTSLWSVGQILHDFTMKVYKSADVDDMDVSDKAQLGMLMDYMFRTEALAIIGAEESLDKHSTNVSGIDKLLDYVWDMVASASRMPKTVIKGQESGTIAGAQYDVMNYYARIASDQENEMKPLLEQLIRIIMRSEEFNVDPDSIEWEIKFNPLWQVDSKTDAEIRKMVAETDQIYIVNGVIGVDEVKDARFGQFGMTDETKLSGDSADFVSGLPEEYIDKLANSIYKGFIKDRGDG